MGNFTQLNVWQLARELAVGIYKLSTTGQLSKDLGFKSQTQRSEISIASNIAEGDELGTDKQSVHFFYIAKGSSAELLTQIVIAHEMGYIEGALAEDLINKCNLIAVMLRKLIQARNS
jgi:four helix bundle protein